MVSLRVSRKKTKPFSPVKVSGTSNRNNNNKSKTSSPKRASEVVPKMTAEEKLVWDSLTSADQRVKFVSLLMTWHSSSSSSSSSSAKHRTPVKKSTGKKSSPSKSPVKKAADEPVYEVEKIIESKSDSKGHRLYLVQWKGYPSSSNTWEPRGNLVNCKHALQEFERKSAESTADELMSTPVKSPRRQSTPGSAARTRTPVSARSQLSARSASAKKSARK